MDIGLCLPQLGGHVSRNGLRAFCERAEELGYGGLWVQEHIFYPLNPVSGYSARPGLKVPDAYRSTLGALETLAAAAAWTCQAGRRDEHPGGRVASAGRTGAAAVDHRRAVRGAAGGRLQRRLVRRGASGHGRRSPHPRRPVRRTHRRASRVLGTGPGAVRGRFFTIPESEIRPKPVQQPRPRLLSGMRSPAGLRRTAEKFDIWNPASGPLEQHLEMFGKLTEMRPAGRKPLELYRRLFTTPPVEVANLRALGVDELCEDVARSREAGVAAVIIDTNFDPALDTPERWAEVPRTLAPLLDAAA